MLPLNEIDFLDFLYNYFKAEYAPIRSLWSTATAEPRQPQRWVSMGHELSPLSFRPANAQAQKDLESLDFFTRKWNLDANFTRGIVVRYAKYELHERLEKKLYESCRLDLMVRKALKEKHLIDAVWPSPAPRNIPQELLQQGVQVRKWYGDMFTKYFRHLHAVDDFSLRPEVDAKIKSSSTLMLVPFVDHLVFGTVDPIMPIVARGAGFSSARGLRKQTDSFGEPDRFEIRFDAPSEIIDTHTRTVVRQCQCLKCGSKRDVTVVISIDPTPGPTSQQNAQRGPSNPNISAPRRQASKTAQRYSPGYNMPGVNEARRPLAPQVQAQNASQGVRPPSPQQGKQCQRCTFLNHPELTSCEMCQGPLPDTLVSKSPSPVQKPDLKPSHSHSASLPLPASAPKQEPKAEERPAAPNRHSLSSTLFSIFPFSQQHQSEHHANLPPPQRSEAAPPSAPAPPVSVPKQKPKTAPVDPPSTKPEAKLDPRPRTPDAPQPPDSPATPPEPDLAHRPEMTLMPLTPPPAEPAARRAPPAGMPQNLMDDFVPVAVPVVGEEEEDAGWGEVRRSDAVGEFGGEDEEEDVEDDRREEMVDLDEVAREGMGVWEREED